MQRKELGEFIAFNNADWVEVIDLGTDGDTWTIAGTDTVTMQARPSPWHLDAFIGLSSADSGAIEVTGDREITITVPAADMAQIPTGFGAYSIDILVSDEDGAIRNRAAGALTVTHGTTRTD